MHSVSEDKDAMYTINHTNPIQRKTQQVYTTLPKEETQTQIGIMLLFLSLVAFLLRLGHCFLPDSAGSLLVEIGEEKVKHFRVPVHRVAFDALLNVLKKTVSSNNQ